MNEKLLQVVFMNKIEVPLRSIYGMHSYRSFSNTGNVHRYGIAGKFLGSVTKNW